MVGSLASSAAGAVPVLRSSVCAASPYRACYGVLRFVMEGGAKGCEVTVSGKLNAQRAKVMKFADGYMISTGEPKTKFVDVCSRNVFMRQGILGIKVKILKPHDPEGKSGPTTPMPDHIVVHEPKEVEVAPTATAAGY